MRSTVLTLVLLSLLVGSAQAQRAHSTRPPRTPSTSTHHSPLRRGATRAPRPQRLEIGPNAELSATAGQEPRREALRAWSQVQRGQGILRRELVPETDQHRFTVEVPGARGGVRVVEITVRQSAPGITPVLVASRSVNRPRRHGNVLRGLAARIDHSAHEVTDHGRGEYTLRLTSEVPSSNGSVARVRTSVRGTLRGSTFEVESFQVDAGAGEIAPEARRVLRTEAMRRVGQRFAGATTATWRTFADGDHPQAPDGVVSEEVSRVSTGGEHAGNVRVLTIDLEQVREGYRRPPPERQSLPGNRGALARARRVETAGEPDFRGRSFSFRSRVPVVIDGVQRRVSYDTRIEFSDVTRNEAGERIAHVSMEVTPTRNRSAYPNVEVPVRATLIRQAMHTLANEYRGANAFDRVMLYRATYSDGREAFPLRVRNYELADYREPATN